MSDLSSAPGDASLAARFPRRATHWQLRTRRLELTRRPLVMGILNATPDSFSDGGRFADPAAAIDHALRLVAEGADILDLGGESTRPYSQGVSLETELERVVPIFTALRGRIDVPLSIDTSKAAVAHAAIELGAEIINDVTGLAGDPQMLPLAQQSGAAVVAMHMQGTPQTMQDHPRYGDVVADVFRELQRRRDELLARGIDRGRIALDPGIGFGKTHQHNITLAAHCHRFHELGCPLLVGHSRKGFIGKALGDKEADRTAGSLGVAMSLARQGVQIVRVHDVASVRQALVLFEATGGIDGQAAKLPE